MSLLDPFNRRDFIARGVAGAAFLAASTAGVRSASSTAGVPALPEAGRFKLPYALARRVTCGPEDRLYVAADQVIGVFDLQGSKLSELIFSSPPRGVAVAPDKTLYVALKDRVMVVAPDGQRTDWESPGAKTWLTGVAVGESFVFAADSGTRQILKYDRSGKLAGRLAQKDPQKQIPGLIVPSPYLDVELAPDGLLRVNNPGRHRVEAYTTEGDLELAWGTAGGGLTGFCGCCNPISVAVLPDGRQITCEKGFPRVKLFSAEGTFEKLLAGEQAFPENNKAGRTVNRADGLLGGLDATVSGDRVIVLDLVTSEVRVLKLA